MTKAGGAWLFGCCLFLCGCGRALDTDECDRLLDHYTELLVKEQLPDLPAQEIAVRQSRARKLAKEDPSYEFDRCSRAVNRRQFDCAMQAVSVDAVERCLVL